MQRYGLFRDYANLRATFFHGFQIETFPPLNRGTSRRIGRSGDGFGGVFPPAVAVVAVVAVILKPITATADPPNLEGTYIFIYIYYIYINI